MAVPSFVGVLGRSPEDLPSGRPQVRDRHLKFHEGREYAGMRTAKCKVQPGNAASTGPYGLVVGCDDGAPLDLAVVEKVIGVRRVIEGEMFDEHANLSCLG
jgi:hypothetical protein